MKEKLLESLTKDSAARLTAALLGMLVTLLARSSGTLGGQAWEAIVDKASKKQLGELILLLLGLLALSSLWLVYLDRKLKKQSLKFDPQIGFYRDPKAGNQPVCPKCLKEGHNSPMAAMSNAWYCPACNSGQLRATVLH